MLEGLQRYLLQNQVIFALVLVFFGWLLIEIKDILVLFFMSYILMATLHPSVEFFEKYRFPRPLAIITTYIIFILLLMVLIFPLFQFGASQFQSLAQSYPRYLTRVAQLLNIDINYTQLQDIISSRLESISTNAFSVTGQFLGGFFSFVTVIVMSFYLLLDNRRIRRGIVSLFPHNEQNRAERTLVQADEKLGAWLRGQIVLSLSIGTVVWIALTLLGWSNLAVPLAIIAAVFEIVPLIGPIIGAIPAVIVALTISPATTALVIGIYILIQLLENNLLVPKIMEKAVGLNPLVIIFGITVGGHLMGIFGALLSIPFISFLFVIAKNYSENT